MGEDEALSHFRKHYVDELVPVFLSRGATPSQADDLVATLWTDCLAGRGDNPPLLTRYQRSRAGLKTWMRRIALNRLVDHLRQSGRVSYCDTGMASDLPGDHLADQAVPPTAVREEALTRLLRDSLEVAFERCPAEDLLRLRLVYLGGVTKQGVARMWGCHRVTVTRDLKRAMARIAECTLEEVKKTDRRLNLTWEDFLELCATQELGFL